MMEEEAIQQNSWSEYTIRLLDTLNLDRVASALMVDLSAGRVVCYVTAPMFRRGYSILLHDRTDGSLTKTWTNQDIIIALPDQLAAERKHDAVLRLSFYYYPVDTTSVTVRPGVRLVPPGGLMLITLPAGTVSLGCCWTRTLNPAPSSVARASSSVWPTTFGSSVASTGT